MPRQSILIVDHDVKAALSLKDKLAAQNVEASIVTDAEEALMFAFEKQPDIITELALPGPDGWELLHTLKEFGLLSHIRVIATTTPERECEDIQEAVLAKGFTAYLPKPLDTANVLSAIEQKSATA